MQLSAQDIQQFVVALKPVLEQIVDERMSTFSKGESEPDMGDDDLDLEGDSDLDIGDDLDGMEDSDEMPEIDGEPSEPDGDEDGSFDDGDEDNEQPGGDVADSDDDTEPFAESDEDEKEDPMADKKPEEMTKEKYAKENAELRERYHKELARANKAEERLNALEAQVGQIRAEKVKAERYSKLNDLLNAGYVLTVEDEIKDCEPLTDEQFGRHCDKIVQRYARAPVGQGLFIPPSEKRDGVPRDEKRERYSKTAQEVTLELRSKGKKAEYAEVLENIARNDGKYVPA